MKLIFFDECKPQPNYRSYDIGAVCLDEASAFAIEAEIAKIAVAVFGDSQLNKVTEFHAKHLFRRTENCRNISSDEEMAEIFYLFLQILTKEEVGLISIRINVDKLSGGQNASDIAFMFLCERANDFVRANKSIGILIGDRENDKASERFSTSLSQYRAAGTGFEYGRNIEYLFESVHFTQSHLSRFLQLADIYSWLLQFRNKGKSTDNLRNKLLWEKLERNGINLYPKKYKVWPK